MLKRLTEADRETLNEFLRAGEPETTHLLAHSLRWPMERCDEEPRGADYYGLFDEMGRLRSALAIFAGGDAIAEGDACDGALLAGPLARERSLHSLSGSTELTADIAARLSRVHRIAESMDGTVNVYLERLEFAAAPDWLEIKKLEPCDARLCAELCAVYNEAQEEELPPEYFSRLAASMGADEGIYAAMAEGRVAGTETVISTERFAYLMALAVAPDFRRRGVATALRNAIRSEMEGAGLQLTVLIGTKNAASAKGAEKLGAKAVSAASYYWFK